MSRFSKDIETVDSSIGWHVNFLLQTVFGVAGVVITIGVILPEFYVACVFAGKDRMCIKETKYLHAL